MKKYLAIGVIIGVLVAAPATVLAYGNTKPIYSLDSQPDNSVSVFDDGPYKCYVVKGRVTESRAFPGYAHAISCVDTRH